MTPRSTTPQFLLIPLMIALLSGLALFVLFLAVQPVISVVIGLIIVGVMVAARQIGLDVPGALRRGLATVLARDSVSLQPLSKRAAAVEMLVIAGMVAVSTYPYYSAPPDIQLSGNEAEWLTNSAYAAYDGLREYGRIPLWQPYLEYGEPLVDNPFSFLLNPFSSLPSLILGAAQGLKLSVALAAGLAGLGGWILGRVLGFGMLGRVLLALLLVGKGNMHAMFSTGYFQLASSQAYFPWIMAGLLATIRLPDKRWPPVLLAVSSALLLFAGNVWYTLPMAICCAVVSAAYVIYPPSPLHPAEKPHTGEGDTRRAAIGLWLRRRIDWPVVRRLAFAGALALGVSAALFIPLWIHQSRIGDHPPEVEAGWIVPLWRSAATFYFNPDPTQVIFRVVDPESGEESSFNMDRLEEFYYSFVVPPWFAVLIFVLLPFYRLRWTRLWLAAWIFVAFFTLWGAGGQPIFLWLYAHIPFLQGWRYVGRALAVGSFWLAVLLAMRADSLWQIFSGLITRLPQTEGEPNRRPYIASFQRGVGYAGMIGLALAGLCAAREVNQGWNYGVENILNPIYKNHTCISWLREQHPDEQLAVWQYGYTGVTTYMHNKVRIYDILADFSMLPMTNTLGHIDLTRALPEYGLGWVGGDREFLRKQGYRPVSGSPRLPEIDLPCLYRKADALPYAYTISLTTLDAIKPPPPPLHGQPEPPMETFPPGTTTPITRFIRQPDAITLAAYGDPSGQTVLTVQERAFPGWGVTIDGAPARLESVGGQVGVILPMDDQPHAITFTYRPPLLFMGAAITIASAIFCVAYLLRADRLLPRRRQQTP